MQSRMDKYNVEETSVSSRTEKNKNLYEDVKNSSFESFDVNSNVSVIGTSSNNIDVNKLSEILDKRYNEYTPKRHSIDIPAYDEPITEEPLTSTKEYDINVILEKAKQGKNIDYNRERLKKVREAQYEILNNLDLELRKVEQVNKHKKEEEENLKNLINTITQLETTYKENEKNRTTTSLDLLSDLAGDEEDSEKTLPQKENVEPVNIEKNEIIEENDIVPEPEEPTQNHVRLIVEEPMDSVNKETKVEEAPKEEVKDNHIEETLSKLNIDISSYDDFSDINKSDTGTLIIKIIIFLIIIGLVVGAVYILNNLLSLGLF